LLYIIHLICEMF